MIARSEADRVGENGAGLRERIARALWRFAYSDSPLPIPFPEPGDEDREGALASADAVIEVLAGDQRNPMFFALLGEDVRVTLGQEDGAPVIVEGRLLGFGDYGEVRVQCDDGEVHYCWPMLDVAARSGRSSG